MGKMKITNLCLQKTNNLYLTYCLVANCNVNISIMVTKEPKLSLIRALASTHRRRSEMPSQKGIKV